MVILPSAGPHPRLELHHGILETPRSRSVPTPWRNVSLHYVALGDSTTVGVGDPMNGSTTGGGGGGGGQRGGTACRSGVRLRSWGRIRDAEGEDERRCSRGSRGRVRGGGRHGRDERSLVETARSSGDRDGRYRRVPPGLLSIASTSTGRATAHGCSELAAGLQMSTRSGLEARGGGGGLVGGVRGSVGAPTTWCRGGPDGRDPVPSAPGPLALPPSTGSEVRRLEA